MLSVVLERSLKSSEPASEACYLRVRLNLPHYWLMWLMMREVLARGTGCAYLRRERDRPDRVSAVLP